MAIHLTAIAGEKAGIIKRGVPCVVGPQHDECMDVIERTAARLGAPLLAHGQHWHVSQERGRLIYQDETGLLDLPLPALPGPHQIMNAGAAIAALRVLRRDELDCEAALTNAYWPARMEHLKTVGALVDLAAPADALAGWRAQPGGRSGVGRDTAPTAPSSNAFDLRHAEYQRDFGGYLAPLAEVAQTA